MDGKNNCIQPWNADFHIDWTSHIFYSYKFAMFKIVPYNFGDYYNISTEGQFMLGNGELSVMDIISIELIQTSIVNFLFPSIILIFNTLTALHIKKQ